MCLNEDDADQRTRTLISHFFSVMTIFGRGEGGGGGGGKRFLKFDLSLIFSFSFKKKKNFLCPLPRGLPEALLLVH